MSPAPSISRVSPGGVGRWNCCCVCGCLNTLRLPEALIVSCVDLELHSYRVLSALPAGCSGERFHVPSHGSQSGPGWQQVVTLRGLFLSPPKGETSS